MPQHTPGEKRKNRRGSAALRALKSAPKSVRQAIKQSTGIADKRERRIAAGKIIRKGRIARDTNPNTGRGSLAKHTVRRAVARGKVGKKQGRKVLKTLSRVRVKSAVETFGKSAPGRLSNRGRAVAKIARSIGGSGKPGKKLSKIAKIAARTNIGSGKGPAGKVRKPSRALPSKKTSAKDLKARLSSARLARGRSTSGKTGAKQGTRAQSARALHLGRVADKKKRTTRHL